MLSIKSVPLLLCMSYGWIEKDMSCCVSQTDRILEESKQGVMLYRLVLLKDMFCDDSVVCSIF